ncbi:hypothetical protein E2C01_065828 [Portunus trituberculatus]|uniref:Uncharacterized protein n=1 Tax=Portunus trituberculatus TaxID=210409 RepID=A0A5B7HGM2_PORTR|nr:hypothetical protein [Portunus trituberculatus]
MWINDTENDIPALYYWTPTQRSIASSPQEANSSTHACRPGLKEGSERVRENKRHKTINTEYN